LRDGGANLRAEPLFLEFRSFQEYNASIIKLYGAMKGCFMEKQTKQVIQAMLEHEITFSHSNWERKELLDIYRQTEAEPSDKPKLSKERYAILFYVISGMLVAAYLLTHLPSVTN